MSVRCGDRVPLRDKFRFRLWPQGWQLGLGVIGITVQVESPDVTRLGVNVSGIIVVDLRDARAGECVGILWKLEKETRVAA